LINTYVYFYILIDSSALQCFLQAQQGKAVMRNILGPICIAMFVESSGVGAGTNPFDNPADSNTATTDETSNNNTGTTDNTDGSGNTETSENTVTSISFGGATPPDGNSVVNVTSENNSIIRTFGGVGDVRYAVENGNECTSIISDLMVRQVIRTRRSQILAVLVRKMYMPHHSP
jgi:hypothetical protein